MVILLVRIPVRRDVNGGITMSRIDLVTIN
jgi:hypothetical protein